MHTHTHPYLCTPAWKHRHTKSTYTHSVSSLHDVYEHFTESIRCPWKWPWNRRRAVSHALGAECLCSPALALTTSARNLASSFPVGRWQELVPWPQTPSQALSLILWDLPSLCYVSPAPRVLVKQGFLEKPEAGAGSGLPQSVWTQVSLSSRELTTAPRQEHNIRTHVSLPFARARAGEVPAGHQPPAGAAGDCSRFQSAPQTGEG